MMLMKSTRNSTIKPTDDVSDITATCRNKLPSRNFAGLPDARAVFGAIGVSQEKCLLHSPVQKYPRERSGRADSPSGA